MRGRTGSACTANRITAVWRNKWCGRKAFDAWILYDTSEWNVQHLSLIHILSTADSQLLAASSAVSSDLLGNILKKKADKNESMVADRVTLLLIAVVAVIIARNPDSSVFNIVSFAWAGFGAV